MIISVFMFTWKFNVLRLRNNPMVLQLLLQNCIFLLKLLNLRRKTFIFSRDSFILFQTFHQSLISIPGLCKILTSLGQDTSLRLGMLSPLRGVRVSVAIWYQLPQLHNPVVNIVTSSSLNLIMSCSSSSLPILLRVLHRALVQGEGSSSGGNSPLAHSSQYITGVPNHIELTIEGAGKHSISYRVCVNWGSI